RAGCRHRNGCRDHLRRPRQWRPELGGRQPPECQLPLLVVWAGRNPLPGGGRGDVGVAPQGRLARSDARSAGMSRRVGYGLAAVATMLTLYYVIPLFLAIISVGDRKSTRLNSSHDQ